MFNQYIVKYFLLSNTGCYFALVTICIKSRNFYHSIFYEIWLPGTHRFRFFSVLSPTRPHTRLNPSFCSALFFSGGWRGATRRPEAAGEGRLRRFRGEPCQLAGTASFYVGCIVVVGAWPKSRNTSGISGLSGLWAQKSETFPKVRTIVVSARKKSAIDRDRSKMSRKHVLHLNGCGIHLFAPFCLSRSWSVKWGIYLLKSMGAEFRITQLTQVLFYAYGFPSCVSLF